MSGILGQMIAGAVKSAGDFGVGVAQEDMRQQKQKDMALFQQKLAQETERLRDELYGKRQDQSRAWQLEDRDFNRAAQIEDRDHRAGREDARHATDDAFRNRQLQQQYALAVMQERGANSRAALSRSGGGGGGATGTRQMEAMKVIQDAAAKGYGVVENPNKPGDWVLTKIRPEVMGAIQRVRGGGGEGVAGGVGAVADRAILAGMLPHERAAFDALQNMPGQDPKGILWSAPIGSREYNDALQRMQDASGKPAAGL